MFCRFVSHRTCSNSELARIPASWIKQVTPDSSVCVRTCHRLEFYASRPFTLPLPPGFSGRWQEIDGLDKTLSRLVFLACGADSRILGEQFVAHQCSRPFLGRQIPGLPIHLVSAAFDLAARLKKSFRFETTFSYDDAVFALLALNATAPGPETLVIVGAGLLGQAIARHPRTSDFRRILVITRKPRDFLSLPGIASGPCRVDACTLQDAALPTEFDCAIATDGLGPEYIERVASLIRSRTRGRTVDLCATPLLALDAPDSLPTYHMESPELLALINDANARLGPVIDPLEKAIGVAIRQLLDGPFSPP